ncbi:hypothetical protein OE88DRAFT_1255050 [Heliocybe sulcata]|uniref:Uncharacterized protein n=1 Tax=Heliocybe sulcata TaxID=5364 RepID=A0A5C3NAP3_9AGAM|nr:hypothetical protein OE88DRAFT_1255050 [Heliocybe sulcata]
MFSAPGTLDRLLADFCVYSHAIWTLNTPTPLRQILKGPSATRLWFHRDRSVRQSACRLLCAPRCKKRRFIKSQQMLSDPAIRHTLGPFTALCVWTHLIQDRHMLDRSRLAIL